MTDPSDPPKPVVIGLSGGIASGKSTVARMLAERGLVWIDADLQARSVVDRPEVAAALRRRFGEKVFAADGSLDREALAAVVFSDAAARADLEAMTHPAVRTAILTQLDAALAKGKSVVLDVPLLAEGGLIERCDVAVFVDADDAVRAARAAARGWSREELRRREQSQAPLSVKKSAARFIIHNSGSVQRTRAQVDAILARSTAPDGRGD